MYFGRLPIGQAMALSHELETGSNLKDNLFIDINPENRWGTPVNQADKKTAQV